MRILTILFIAFMANSFTPTHASAGSLEEDQAKAVRYAETASVRALTFGQGDIASLMDAKDDFTSKGWDEFMKNLNGWLEEKGAPKFSSNFSPSGKPLDIRLESGVLYLTIPGVLTHESRNEYGGLSTTAYRTEINIQLAEKPLKIEQLTQKTCGGAKTKTSCR